MCDSHLSSMIRVRRFAPCITHTTRSLRLFLSHARGLIPAPLPCRQVFLFPSFTVFKCYLTLSTLLTADHRLSPSMLDSFHCSLHLMSKHVVSHPPSPQPLRRTISFAKEPPCLCSSQMVVIVVDGNQWLPTKITNWV